MLHFGIAVELDVGMDPDLVERRTETLAVTAWSPATARALETFFVSRATTDGALRSAGAVQLGLSGEQREALRAAIAARLEEPGRRVRRVGDGIQLTVDLHGAANRPLRDAVARSFAIY